MVPRSSKSKKDRTIRRPPRSSRPGRLRKVSATADFQRWIKTAPVGARVPTLALGRRCGQRRFHRAVALYSERRDLGFTPFANDAPVDQQRRLVGVVLDDVE